MTSNEATRTVGAVQLGVLVGAEGRPDHRALGGLLALGLAAALLHALQPGVRVIG